MARQGEGIPSGRAAMRRETQRKPVAFQSPSKTGHCNERCTRGVSGDGSFFGIPWAQSVDV